MQRKKGSLLLILLITSVVVNSQNKEKLNLQKNLFGVQVGLVGAWVYYENHLKQNFTLRTELGFDGNYSYNNNSNPSSQYFLIPSVTVEPRLYYNINKRIKEKKNTNKNSGNFVSLRASYNPNILVITNSNNDFNSSIFKIIPSWGMRRNLTDILNIELRLGFGYVTNKSIENQNEGFIPDITFRFGYAF